MDLFGAILSYVEVIMNIHNCLLLATGLLLLSSLVPHLHRLTRTEIEPSGFLLILVSYSEVAR